MNQGSIDQDAKALRKAMKGFGTDETALITILCNKERKYLEAVSSAFQAEFKRDLMSDIKSETSSDFERVLVGLLTDPEKYDAQHLNTGMVSKNTKMLNEILCTRTPDELRAISSAFAGLYNKILPDEISKSFNGNLRNCYLHALGEKKAGSASLIGEHVDALHNAGEAKVGTNEKIFVDILSGFAADHVYAVAEAYQKKYGTILTNVIKDEFSGDLERVLIGFATPADQYLADCLEKAFRALGVDDTTVIRILCSQKERATPGLPAVCAKLLAQTQKTIVQWVQKKGHSDEKKALTAMVSQFA